MHHPVKLRFALTAILTITLSCVQNGKTCAKNEIRPAPTFTKLGAGSVSETFHERFKYPPPVEYLGDQAFFDENSNNSLISIRNNLEKKRYLVGVYIDHSKLTRLSGGCCKAYIVQPGRHELQIGNDDVASQPLTVEIKSGEAKFFECVSLPQGKISTFFQGPKRLKLKLSN